MQMERDRGWGNGQRRSRRNGEEEWPPIASSSPSPRLRRTSFRTRTCRAVASSRRRMDADTTDETWGCGVKGQRNGGGMGRASLPAAYVYPERSERPPATVWRPFGPQDRKRNRRNDEKCQSLFALFRLRCCPIGPKGREIIAGGCPPGNVSHRTSRRRARFSASYSVSPEARRAGR